MDVYIIIKYLAKTPKFGTYSLSPKIDDPLATNLEYRMNFKGLVLDYYVKYFYFMNLAQFK